MSDELVVHGNHRYLVPRRFTHRIHDDQRRVELTVEVVVDHDGIAEFMRVDIDARGGISPIAMQRLPWKRYLGVALAANDSTPTTKHDTDQGPARRNQVTRDRLEEVLRLRDEAQAQGARWDEYAARRLNVTPVYARRLAMRADRMGGST